MDLKKIKSPEYSDDFIKNFTIFNIYLFLKYTTHRKGARAVAAANEGIAT